MNTRKFPRTLQEAFGPYTTNQIEEAKEPYQWAPQFPIFIGFYAWAVILMIVVF
jgi:hypothetical protein